AKRKAYVKRLSNVYKKNLGTGRKDYIHGTAFFSGSHKVKIVLADQTEIILKAKHILITIRAAPGITLDGFFELDKQPGKVAVIAGYIAVEMVGMLHALRTETHLFIRHDQIFRTFDPMIQNGGTAECQRQRSKTGLPRTGVTATALGYGVQIMVGSEYGTRYKSLVYVASSASAKLIADVGLFAFETVKVGLQTAASPGNEGDVRYFGKTIITEYRPSSKKHWHITTACSYRGIYPLPMGSPDTGYGHEVFILLKHCSNYTAIAFAEGYLSGILGAVVSHPADATLSKLTAHHEQAMSAAIPAQHDYDRTSMAHDSFKVAIGLPATGGNEPVPRKDRQDKNFNRIS
ncbi:hypothetical protein IAQ61_009963, partial [Plenodomus lingam]